jgi:phosphoribosylformimino-5-aminoimidazole carboxamide ribotide isomerase
MEIIPSIDLRGGNVVRLAQGDFARETRYDVDAVALAGQYLEQGAQWLHVVDLDGARSGSLENLNVLTAIARTSIKVQAGGGVRSVHDVVRLLHGGVARVVIGSTAVREPESVERWIADFGAERVCIALDTRRDASGRWTLPVAGWTQASGATLDDLASRYALAGATHALCTDIDRDGMLSGPNVSLYAHLRKIVPGLQLQASGGIRNVDDLRALSDTGVAGAILGRSLVEGRLSLTEAMLC